MSLMRSCLALVVAILTLSTVGYPEPLTPVQSGQHLQVMSSGQNPADSLIKIHLKFREGSKVRLRKGAFVTLGADDLSGVSKVISSYPDIRMERLYSRSEQQLDQEQRRLEAKTGKDLPDLTCGTASSYVQIPTLRRWSRI